MAARNALSVFSLSKPFINRGNSCIQRRLVSSSNVSSAAFGTNRRFTAVLAASCGVTLSAVVSYRMLFSSDVKARPIKASESGSEHFSKKGISDLSVTLYQYQNCPFCGKVRAFLDYYGIKYNKVEVSPLWKGEIGFSKYKKVPIVIADDKQVRYSVYLMTLQSTPGHP